jgi:hypothetical protein
MKFRVYSGFLDWYVTVDAPNEELAVVFGKQAMLDALKDDASMWAVKVEPQQERRGCSGE